jgi:hypothetical protein
MPIQKEIGFNIWERAKLVARIENGFSQYYDFDPLV